MTAADIPIWADDSGKGRKNVIYTSLYAGHVFASCMLPASLFEGD